MSPEANKPETQIGSDKFVPGIHPTDGVRPFGKGDLPEVGESLITDRLPNDARDLHPETLEVSNINKVPLAPVPEAAIEAPKSKRGVLALAGGALTAALAAGTIFGLSLGGDDQPKERPQVAATPTPGPETTPTPTDTVETPAPVSIDELHMLQPGGTAESVHGNFAVVLSDIVNERVEAGIPVSTGEDLTYLTSGMDAQTLERFDDFVQGIASNVEEESHRRAQNGVDSDITFSLYSQIISQEPLGDGGYVVVAEDEYDAMDSEGMLAGVVLANLDKHQYTFSRTLVDLPNGTQKETFVLTGFENLDKTLS